MRGLKVSVAPNHRIASPSPVIRALILYFCHHYKQEHNKGQLEQLEQLGQSVPTHRLPKMLSPR